MKQHYGGILIKQKQAVHVGWFQNMRPVYNLNEQVLS